LKVVGAFHGLSRARSDARRYPAIDPLASWSHYPGVGDAAATRFARDLLRQGDEVAEMMKVVGEEGTSQADFVRYLQAEFLDAVYLQQDAFDPVDGASSAERQALVFGDLVAIVRNSPKLEGKGAARRFFQTLTQAAKEWNRAAWGTEAFEAGRARVQQLVAEVSGA
jgi:V/A-type H+-transporting ATPase subunit A